MEKYDQWLEEHALQMIVWSMALTACGMALIPLMRWFPPVGFVAIVGATGCFLSSLNLLVAAYNKNAS